MADLKTTWESGDQKWFRKAPGQKRDITDPQIYDFDNIVTTTLVACDIKSDAVGESWVVKHSNEVLRQFEITDIKSWEVEQNIMTIYSNSEYPLKLVFISTSHARKADTRLYLIMNGHEIVNCDDDLMFQCGVLKNLNVSF